LLRGSKETDYFPRRGISSEGALGMKLKNQNLKEAVQGVALQTGISPSRNGSVSNNKWQ
jgi:hypothetical protein